MQEAKDGGAFAGVVVEKVAGRLYPEKRLASHLVGFVGDGNSGLAGIEKRCDDELLRRAGKDFVLTIDADIQFSLEEIARKAMTTTGAEAVILLAPDPRTGEVLAYVAMPDFDPNDYASSPGSPGTIGPASIHYEPGSVFKVFTMASVLDLGGADANTTFYCDGAFHKVAPSGEKITIKCLGVHGDVNIQKILEFSCNAGRRLRLGQGRVRRLLRQAARLRLRLAHGPRRARRDARPPALARDLVAPLQADDRHGAGDLRIGGADGRRGHRHRERRRSS